MMIEVLWRLREYFEIVDEAMIPVAHALLEDHINTANRTHNYATLLGYIKAQTAVCDKLIQANIQADAAKIEGGMKALIKSIYNECPGAELAVKKDGTIGKNYLP